MLLKGNQLLRISKGEFKMLSQGGLKMLSLGLFVRLEAKPGKEEEVAAFLKQGLQMANQEPTTLLWFALRLGPSTFAIFDAFADESGRQTHLNGPIAKALMANAPDLLAVPPSIEKTEILGAKLSQELRSAA
jgi:quinol monooxygenase YgiN